MYSITNFDKQREIAIINRVMGRIIEDIKINGKKYRALFDTGSRNSYIIAKATNGFPKLNVSPKKVGLGGTSRILKKKCIFEARINGKPADIEAYIVNKLGKDEEGKEIHILFGSLMMQKWGIRPVPDEERLDLSHYSKEFTEF